jgi:hypothetical protein
MGRLVARLGRSNPLAASRSMVGGETLNMVAASMRVKANFAALVSALFTFVFMFLALWLMLSGTCCARPYTSGKKSKNRSDERFEAKTWSFNFAAE